MTSWINKKIPSIRLFITDPKTGETSTKLFSYEEIKEQKEKLLEDAKINLGYSENSKNRAHEEFKQKIEGYLADPFNSKTILSS